MTERQRLHRRALLKKGTAAGAAGAAVWAAPVVTSMAVGAAAISGVQECRCDDRFSVERVCWDVVRADLIQLTVAATLGTCTGGPACTPSTYWQILFGKSDGVTQQNFYSGVVDSNGQIRIEDAGDDLDDAGQYRLALEGSCDGKNGCTRPTFLREGDYTLGPPGDGSMTNLDPCD